MKMEELKDTTDAQDCSKTFKIVAEIYFKNPLDYKGLLQQAVQNDQIFMTHKQWDKLIEMLDKLISLAECRVFRKFMEQIII